MWRLIGFVFGVAVALVLLTALVDAPIRESAKSLVGDALGVFFEVIEPAATRPEAADLAPPRDAALRQVRAAPLATPDAEAESVFTVSAPAEQPEPTTQRPKSPATGPDSNDLSPATSTGSQAQLSPHASKREPPPSDSPDSQPGWQALWQPFRSELSAKGFAGELQRLTGRRYRVRRTSPWAYQVELAYADARQRAAALEEIRRKTGLGLPQQVQP